MEREQTAYEKYVDYSLMDPAKIYAQRAGLETAAVLRRYGYKEISWSRGESCYLKRKGGKIYGEVIEGLGTKNLILVDDPSWLDPEGYAVVGQDAVGMITGDMASLGVQPMSMGMHLDVGSSDWFKQEKYWQALFDGWKKACVTVGAAWGYGETATLRGITNPKSFSLSGSATGEVLWPERLMTPFRIRIGDVIILFASNRIHANGLTLAREVADEHPDHYSADCSGETYAKALMKPTVLYSPIIQQCLREEIPLHYGVHITGHGWAKLMRSPVQFAYVIDKVPPIHDVFEFIQQRKQISDREMYKTFNMGAGFAVYVAKRWAGRVIEVAEKHHVSAFVAGYVENAAEKHVYIRPKDIIFDKEDLKVR